MRLAGSKDYHSFLPKQCDAAHIMGARCIGPPALGAPEAGSSAVAAAALYTRFFEIVAADKAGVVHRERRPFRAG